MRLPNTQDPTNADAAIAGPFDTGATFRVGARFGPEAIRGVSHLLRRHNHVLGVTILDYLSVIDTPGLGARGVSLGAEDDGAGYDLDAHPLWRWR